MSQRVCVASQKGGVGKSTTTTQLAYHLVSKGKKVLVVDFDAQGNTSLTLARDMDGTPVPLVGTQTKELFRSDLEKVVVMHCPRGMDLIHAKPSDHEMYDLESISLSQTLVPRDNCRHLFSQYDYVLIDCPPTLGRLLIAGLNMGTHVISPVEVASYAVEGIIGLLGTIDMVTAEMNPGLEMAGVFLNKFDKNSVEQSRERDKMRDALGDNLLRETMPDRTPVDTATNLGKPISELRYAHVAAKEMRSLLEEIEERVNHHG